MKKKNRSTIFLSIAFIVFIPLLMHVIPLKFSETIDSYFEVSSKCKWMVIRGDKDQLTSLEVDNSNGLIRNYHVIQFDRGESVELSLSPIASSVARIEKGDTVGQITSSQLEETIAEIEGELSVVKAELTVKSSGEKEAIIKEAENRLDYTNIGLNEKRKSFERICELFKKNYASKEEYETAESEFKQLETELKIYQSQLEAAKSGAKTEEVNLLFAQINALNVQLKNLYKRREGYKIISPISGEITPSFSSDTLLTVMDLEKVILTMPIRLTEKEKILTQGTLRLKLKNCKDIVNAELILLSKEVKYLDGEQIVLANLMIDNHKLCLLPGELLSGKIILGQIPLWQHVENYITN